MHETDTKCVARSAYPRFSSLAQAIHVVGPDNAVKMSTCRETVSKPQVQSVVHKRQYQTAHMTVSFSATVVSAWNLLSRRVENICSGYDIYVCLVGVPTRF